MPEFKRPDKYALRARAQGYRARSIFKLEEIDKKYKIFGKKDIVIDLGAAPGSWLQYIVKKIGPRGMVYGIDEQDITPLPFSNLKTITANVFHLDKLGLLPDWCDVLVSDLAPKTSGTKFADSAKSLKLVQQALLISKNHLKIGGNFVAKIFASPELDDFFQEFSNNFSFSKRFKPSACRDASKEFYLIGKKFKK